ncbi:hypothetical protein PVAP13_6KG122918 [Panicum virgatum]|uniref:Uncharacterized protein n=1 Tax=Panicum virgatum TaxID=38727 RepID=A0A8T0RFQ9_PANVG|nr:hypothetical protein PVAP13_6KG122918 [Panicum virgatum]
MANNEFYLGIAGGFAPPASPPAPPPPRATLAAAAAPARTPTEEAVFEAVLQQAALVQEGAGVKGAAALLLRWARRRRPRGSSATPMSGWLLFLSGQRPSCNVQVPVCRVRRPWRPRGATGQRHAAALPQAARPVGNSLAGGVVTQQ